MKIFRGLPNLNSQLPCALAIGNFDGVHLGHQALLKQLCETARAHNIAAGVLTFEPHPREFFAPHQAPPRIYNLRSKLGALRETGIDRVMIARFDAYFAVQTPDEFVRQVLMQTLKTRFLFVGDDFRFGAAGAGSVSYLEQIGYRYGFETTRIATCTLGRQRISSSSIRAALSSGDITTANQLIGRPYMLAGHVIHGSKLGRKLGFPTLNLRVAPYPHKRSAALSGIFVAQVHGIADHPLPAVASLGIRPTIDNSAQTLLEAHLLDFNESLYGRVVGVEFLYKLRDEVKYPDLDTLRQAIAQDTEQTRLWFAKYQASPMRASS